MFKNMEITDYKMSDKGTLINGIILNEDITNFLNYKKVKNAEIRFDDGRTITNMQRKKIYATLSDISYYMGESINNTKKILKEMFLSQTKIPYFSLADCSIDTASSFLSFLLNLCLNLGISLSQTGIERCEDIDKYLYGCIKYKKCAICGAEGKLFTNEENQYISLCSRHYDELLIIGYNSFLEKYHINLIKNIPK